MPESNKNKSNITSKSKAHQFKTTKNDKGSKTASGKCHPIIAYNMDEYIESCRLKVEEYIKERDAKVEEYIKERDAKVEEYIKKINLKMIDYLQTCGKGNDYIEVKLGFKVPRIKNK